MVGIVSPTDFIRNLELLDNIFNVLSDIANFMLRSLTELYSYIAQLPALIPKILSLLDAFFPPSVLYIMSTILMFAIVKLIIGRES